MVKEVGSTDEGIILDITIEYGHHKSEIVWWQDHHHLLKIGVTEPPHKGKANEEVVNLLCKKLKVSKSDITIIQGENHENKQVLIKSVKPEDLKRLKH